MYACAAIAHGAATVVNAISTGNGAAIGVDLWTSARVELNEEAGNITASILSDPSEQTHLIKTVAERVLKRYRLHERFGVDVKTDSNIPIARGMKSSSVAANAVALATIGALQRRARDNVIINIAVDSAIQSGVTVTGAFDDASASYYGGIVVTSNKHRRILLRNEISKGYRILFHVPAQKSYTADADLGKFKKLRGINKLVHRMALRGQFWEALTLNGLAHSIVLGWDPTVAIKAMAAGATASGLSGKGPATVAIVKNDMVSEVRSAINDFEGEIIEARPNNRKAMIIGDNF